MSELQQADERGRIRLRSRFSLPIMFYTMSESDQDAIRLRLNRLLPLGWDLPIAISGPIDESNCDYLIQIGETTAQPCGETISGVLDWLSRYWGDRVGREEE